MTRKKKWTSVSKGSLNLLDEKNAAAYEEGSAPAHAAAYEEGSAPAHAPAEGAEDGPNTENGPNTEDEQNTEDGQGAGDEGVEGPSQKEGAEGMAEDRLQDGSMDVLDDWAVANALKIHRRVLHYYRNANVIDAYQRSKTAKAHPLRFVNGGEEAERGIDWDCVNGEIGMTRAFVEVNGVNASMLPKVGTKGLVSVSMTSRTPNPQIVLCTREDNGHIVPVRINDCAFVKGMLIEVKKSLSIYILAYTIPRKHY